MYTNKEIMFWIEKLNIIKVPVLPHLIYTFNSVIIKIPTSFFEDNSKLDLNFIQKGNETRRVKIILSFSIQNMISLFVYIFFHQCLVVQNIQILYIIGEIIHCFGFYYERYCFSHYKLEILISGIQIMPEPIPCIVFVLADLPKITSLGVSTYTIILSENSVICFYKSHSISKVLTRQKKLVPPITSPITPMYSSLITL